MKTTYFLTIGLSVLLLLSACSESDQPTVSNVVTTAEKTEVDTDSQLDADGSLDAEGSRDADGSQLDADGSQFDGEGSFAIIDSVSDQLELENEQKSVAELEQSTEAANQALQNLAEQKTVNEAQDLAAEQAASINPGKEDVATTLAENSLSTESVAEQPFIAPSSLRAIDPIRGEWTKKGQKIAGEWLIEARNGYAYLILDDDFKTRNAPDLKFVLSNTPVEDLTNRNAMDGALFVANLESPSGQQVYRLPSNFYEYSTLLLHCEKYTKLWGAAAINK